LVCFANSFGFLLVDNQFFRFVYFLANEVFQFFVRAEDHGSPVLGTEAPVDVLILDPQERAPTFERTSSKYFISESAPVGNDVED
jgi:hypothetical protein